MGSQLSTYLVNEPVPATGPIELVFTSFIELLQY